MIAARAVRIRYGMALAALRTPTAPARIPTRQTAPGIAALGESGRRIPTPGPRPLQPIPKNPGKRTSAPKTFTHTGYSIPIEQLYAAV